MNLPTASELLLACDAGRSLPGPASNPDFDLATAYRVAAQIADLRRARGESPAGYKIGFTNRQIWPLYGVQQPIWGPVWDTSLHLMDGTDARISLEHLAEPRLEPEIVIGLRDSPAPGADGRDAASMQALIECIDWVAHGFEIVQSIWPNWRFDAAHGVAAQSLHASLWVGPRVPLAALGPNPATSLAGLRLHLSRNHEPIAEGAGENVLDGPLQALGHLVAGLAARGERITPGAVVTTGTLTDAQRLAPGQTWRTTLEGVPLAGLTLAT